MARSRTKATTLFSILLLVAPTALAQVKNDFGLYPAGAQSCLEDADERSNCSGDTVPEMNACLCSNGGSFVTNAARCIGREARNTLRTVWSTMNTSCDDSNTPLSVSEDDFISIGERETASASSTTASSTSSTSETATGSGTPSPTNTDDEGNDDDGGLSVGAKAGIGVGAAVGAAILGGVVAMIWKSRSSRAAHDESSQAMLGSQYNNNNNPEAGSGNSMFPSTAAAVPGWKASNHEEKFNRGGWRPESGMTAYSATTDSNVASSWAGSPPPQQQQHQHQTWGHHPDQPWPGSPPFSGTGQPLAVVPESANQGPGVYELSSSEAAMPPPPAHQAFEMPASPGPNAPHYPGSNWAR